MALLRVAVALAVVAACSDPLVDAGYRGESLFTVRGQVLQVASSALTNDPVRVSLFWSPTGLTNVDPSQLVEQPAVSVAISFPASFAMHVFEPPGPEHLTTSGYGVGVVLVYQDRDGSGGYSPGERVGGASARAVVYAQEAVPAAASPTGEPLTTGFQLLRLPNGCGSANTCPIRIGIACTTDDDCAGGTCLVDGIFPGGYCTLLSADAPCVPSGAVAVEWPDLGDAIFVRSCAENAECREAEGYQCDPALGACLPAAFIGGAACGSEAVTACDADEDCAGGVCDFWTVPESPTCLSGCGPGLSGTTVGRSCDKTADCPAGAICDATLHLCLPDLPVSIEIDPDFVMQPLCSG